ncbi:MAG: TonB-dependent receptor [Bryobacterales bacterium]|nr:TonB-dependent receptor [Bryobacterales bacterium]
MVSVALCFLWVVGLAPGEEPKRPVAAAEPKAAGTSESPAPAPGTAVRNDLNLLGRTNTQSGESRRNENVQFNLIDNNALKELNIRLGTTATLVTEFKPERQYYGVEFGNAPPGLLHVAPGRLSGTHGLLFYTHLNSVFSARSFFQVGAVRPARENNYGANFVTPLWRKAWLTLDGTQAKIRGNVNGNVLVPRAEERSALATDPAIRGLINRWLTAYPLEAPNRTDIDPRALNTNAPQRINTDTAAARIDQALTAKDKLVARHAWTTQSLDAFQLVAGQNPDTTTKSHNSRLTWQRTWSAATVSDVTLGFDRVRSQLMPEPNAVGPQVQIGTAYTTLGPGSNVPLDRVQNRFRQAAMLTSRRGPHRLVFGGELTRLQFNGREASSNRGNFYFRNDFGRDAITNFRMGIPSRYSTGLGELDRGFRRWEQQVFAGDTWQARPGLTLTFGVRYEPARVPYEVNGRTKITARCDCNNIGPSFGFAQRLPGEWGVLRGAYGLHYGEIFAVTYQQLRWNIPEFQKIETLAPPLLDPLRNAVIGSDARSTFFSVPDGLKTPYSHQYNLSWETQVARQWRVQVGYLGSRTHKLLMLNHLNRAVPVAGVPFTTATISERRPDPRYFEVREIQNASRAYFDAARVTLVVPEWRGLTVDASYWFSKAIDFGAAYTNTAAGDDARQAYSQSQNLVAQDLKGPSVFDQSHAGLFRVRYALPGRRALLSKWALSVVWLAKTGMPFTVISGSDSPGFGNVDGTNGDRPNLVDPAVLGRTIGHPDTAVSLLPRSAFAYIPIGAERGNLGRNTFRRAGFQNMNASLGRTFQLAGERTLTFRAESVNFTNSPQFAEPNADLSSPAFGKITNTLNDGRTFQFTLQARF